MKVIPAIDIVNGKCVRLTKGSLKHKVVYNDNPVDQAIIFQSMGFKKIHIIDLDGALDDNSINYKTIVEIRKNISIEIQLGGGIRNYKQIKEWFDLGVEKLIIGSMAQKSPENQGFFVFRQNGLQLTERFHQSRYAWEHTNGSHNGAQNQEGDARDNPATSMTQFFTALFTAD